MLRTICLRLVFIKIFEFFVADIKCYRHRRTLHPDRLPLGRSARLDFSPSGEMARSLIASFLSSTTSSPTLPCFTTYFVSSDNSGLHRNLLPSSLSTIVEALSGGLDEDVTPSNTSMGDRKDWHTSPSQDGGLYQLEFETASASRTNPY